MDILQRSVADIQDLQEKNPVHNKLLPNRLKLVTVRFLNRFRRRKLQDLQQSKGIDSTSSTEFYGGPQDLQERANRRRERHRRRRTFERSNDG